MGAPRQQWDPPSGGGGPLRPPMDDQWGSPASAAAWQQPGGVHSRPGFPEQVGRKTRIWQSTGWKGSYALALPQTPLAKYPCGTESCPVPCTSKIHLDCVMLAGVADMAFLLPMAFFEKSRKGQLA
jgi:hypothetical protein